MYHYATSENDPFRGDYRSALSPYSIDVSAPINNPGPADISRQIYDASGDTTTAFPLWVANPRLKANEYPSHIVLLHYIFQVARRLGHPITKWDTKAFTATG